MLNIQKQVLTVLKCCGHTTTLQARHFCSNITTKYLSQWRSFLAVSVQHEVFVTYQVGFLLAFQKIAHELMGILFLTMYKVFADKL
jgi:hypothetical protein